MKTEPHTKGPILAHELLGRAFADFNKEPQGPLYSETRDKADDLAMNRANPAFDRMNKKMKKIL